MAGAYLVRSLLDNEPFPARRHFQFTYHTLLSGFPETARQVRLWIPLASSRDGQKVIERKVSASAPYEIHAELLYGNEMLYAEAAGPGVGKIEFKIYYEVEVDRSLLPSSSAPDEVEKFLKPSRLGVVNDVVKGKAKEATEGMASWREKAQGIYDYVLRHMTYDKTLPGWGKGDTMRACLLGRGNCTDFHSLFISIAHAAEIPARFKIGFTVPSEGEGPIQGYHCWAEFFDDKKGWVPVDASEAWKNPRMKRQYFGNFDTHKFFLSLGRDISLMPKQDGEPVNIFITPYVEVDGKLLSEGEIAVQKDFYFRNLQN